MRTETQNAKSMIYLSAYFRWLASLRRRLWRRRRASAKLRTNCSRPGPRSTTSRSSSSTTVAIAFSPFMGDIRGVRWYFDKRSLFCFAEEQTSRLQVLTSMHNKCGDKIEQLEADLQAVQEQKAALEVKLQQMSNKEQSHQPKISQLVQPIQPSQASPKYGLEFLLSFFTPVIFAHGCREIEMILLTSGDKMSTGWLL